MHFVICLKIKCMSVQTKNYKLIISVWSSIHEEKQVRKGYVYTRDIISVHCRYAKFLEGNVFL